jgi:hypothetical protein
MNGNLTRALYRSRALSRQRYLGDGAAGLVPATTYLAHFSGVCDETDHNVWTIILGSCHSLYNIWAQRGDKFTSISAQITPPTVQNLAGVQKGRHELISSYAEAPGRAGTLGDDQTFKPEHARYAQYKESEAVDRNVVPALVSILASGGAGNTKNSPPTSKQPRLHKKRHGAYLLSPHSVQPIYSNARSNSLSTAKCAPRTRRT